jgi:hypothetical protein
MRHISEKYNCDASVVSELLNKNNIKKRSISQQNNLNKQRIYGTK